MRTATSLVKVNHYSNYEIALSSTPTHASTQEKIQSIQNRSTAIKLYAKKELMVYARDVMRQRHLKLNLDLIWKFII